MGTPILDRQQPAPAPPLRNRRRALLIGGSIGAVLPFMAFFFPSVAEGSSYAVLAFVPALFLGVVLHELGHLAAGLAAGLEFRRIMAGPWMLTKESTGYRLRFLRGGLLTFAGQTVMTPPAPIDLRRRFAVFGAGGPLATLLLFLPIAFVPSGALRLWLLMANTLLAAFSWIPMEFAGHYTDGKLLQLLRRRGPEAERLAAVLYLMSVDSRGIPPNEWPAQVVANLSVEGDGKAYRAGGRIFLHVYLRETASPAEIAAALERVLELGGEMRADLRRLYSAEAAYWQATTNRNAELAKAWLEDARAVKGVVSLKGWDAPALAAIALAEGDGAKLREQLQRAMAYLDSCPGPSGSVAATRARLMRLTEVAAAGGAQ